MNHLGECEEFTDDELSLIADALENEDGISGARGAGCLDTSPDG